MKPMQHTVVIRDLSRKSDMHRDVPPANTPADGGRRRREWAELRAIRSIAAAYTHVPTWVAAGAAFLLTALVAAITHTVNGNPSAVALAAGITAGLTAALHFSLRRPDIAATLIALLVAITFTPPIAVAYAAASAGTHISVLAGAVTTLVITYVLIALFAHRTSRGRPWVTVVAALAALMFAGPFLLLIYPPFGFGWGWASAALVIWLRGGGIAWLRDLRHRLKRKTRAATSTATSAVTSHTSEQSGEQARATATAATATLLDTLPAGYTTFHGRRTPKFNRGEHHRVDHLVVGPTGLSVITSHAFKGRVVDDPDHGLTHDSTNPVDVSGILNDADVLASIVATRTKLKWLPVRQIVVIHDAVLPAKRSRVGLISASGNTLGVITVMSPDMLIDHITATGPDNRQPDYAPLTGAQVAQAVARIDRLCPPHRVTSRKARRIPISLYRADMVVMDNDGNRRIPTPRAPLPMFPTSHNPFDIADGQQVCLLTDQGVFDGYHIAGDPVVGDDGITRVPVLDETINLTAHQDTGANELPLLWMPFDSIQPVHH